MSKDKAEAKTVADFPELVKQWHNSKNGELTPEKIVAGSHKKVWWKCDKGPDHEWNAQIGSRTGKQKSGCPFCANQRVSITNSLATLFPEIAKEWHTTKNGDLTPETIVATTTKRVWWKCKEGPDHEWETKLNNRTTRVRGCPFCSGKKVSVTNTLTTLFPEIAKEWHPTKNGDLTPDKVLAGTNTKYWWRCIKGPDHEWKAQVYARTGQMQGCPFCAGRRVSITNALSVVYPEIAKEWHPTKNENLKPNEITFGTHKKVWWKCEKGPDHEWKAQIVKRTTQNRSCPFCSGNRVSITNSLAKLAPEIAEEWHPTKNGKLGPDRITSKSGKMIWWRCKNDSEHIWEAPPHDRFGKGQGCPFCNLAGGFEIIGYIWERICHRIAGQLLKGKKWEWHPKIETPEVGERNWILPEILVKNPDGSSEIIEVKKSPIALTHKDAFIYPKYTDKVIFWCLNIESPIEIDSEESFVFISSDKLIEQLKTKITDNNKRTISRIINDIKKLKEGTLLSQQKLLTEFIK